MFPRFRLAPPLAALAFCHGALAAVPPGTPPAPGGLYVTDPAHTSVIWSLDHSGLSHWTARFVGVRGTLDWRPENPTASVLRVEIDPGSVRTDFPAPEENDFDGMIAASEDFLAGQSIAFVSTLVELTGQNRGLVHGDLTFRNQTHPVTLDVTFNGSMAEHPHAQTAHLGFSAKTSFQRSGWGLDVLTPDLGDRIDLVVETQLVPAAE